MISRLVKDMISATIDDETKPISQIDFHKDSVIFHVRNQLDIIVVKNQPVVSFSITPEISELFKVCFDQSFHRLLGDSLIETVSKYHISQQSYYLWNVLRNYLWTCRSELMFDAIKHEDIFRAMMFPADFSAMIDICMKTPNKLSFAEKLQSYHLCIDNA